MCSMMETVVWMGSQLVSMPLQGLQVKSCQVLLFPSVNLVIKRAAKTRIFARRLLVNDQLGAYCN